MFQTNHLKFHMCFENINSHKINNHHTSFTDSIYKSALQMQNVNLPSITNVFYFH